MVRTQCGQMETIFLTFFCFEDFEVLFGELLEDEIVAEAADGIAGAFFLLQNAESWCRDTSSRAKAATISRPCGS